MVDTTGNIYGTVKDADTGKPLYNCSITLNPLGDTSTTGSDGTFRFTNIEGGQYSIQVSKMEYAVNSKNITVVPGDEARVDFLLYKESATKGTICGTVKDSQTSEPLSGCNILLQPTGKSTTTAINGYYVFDNLDPGEYFLSITKSNYHSNSRSNISVKAGETSTVDMLLKEFDSTERLPDVNSLTIREITSSSARFAAVVSDDGSHNVTECGFVYGLSPSATTIDNGVKIRATKDSSGRFSADAKGLQPLCQYYVAAYAINALGVSYSANMPFTTLKSEEIPAPTNVIYVSINGNDNNDGSSWTQAKRTISAAMKISAASQSIWVSAGNYSETLSPNNGIYIYGGFIGSEKNINDRPKNSRSSISGISCNVYTQETIIDGFKVKNKSYIASGNYAVLLRDYIFLRNCEISNNQYNVISVSCQKKSCVIENCLICSNTLTTSSSGAIEISYTGVVTLVNCFIQGNKEGHAIFSNGYLKTINCVITNNQYGIRTLGSGGQFINTTLASNTNYALGAQSDTQMYNCIIWNNEIIEKLYGNSDGTITQEFCEYMNTADNNSIRFVTPAAKGTSGWSNANWALSAGSSCIDRGANIFYAVDEDPYDIIGNPRISNGTIDIGAYEYQH